jgi:hypothetical protein
MVIFGFSSRLAAREVYGKAEVIKIAKKGIWNLGRIG